jgi:hypothetical protein
VAPNHVEIENDYTNLVTTGTYASIAATYPQTLVIFGTSDPHLDVEIGPLATNRSSAGGRPVDGASDLELPAKYELGRHSNVVWAVEGTVTIPSGAPAFTYGNAQFLGDLNRDYEIDSTFALGGTFSFRAAGAVTLAGAAQSYFNFVPSGRADRAAPRASLASQRGVGLFLAPGPTSGPEATSILPTSAISGRISKSTPSTALRPRSPTAAPNATWKPGSRCCSREKPPPRLTPNLPCRYINVSARAIPLSPTPMRRGRWTNSSPSAKSPKPACAPT